MARSVDPKNASTRETDEWRFGDWVQGIRPGRFYLREILVVLLVLVLGYIAYDFSQFVATNERYQVSVKVIGLDALSKQPVVDEIEGMVGTSENPKSLVEVSVDEVRTALLNRIPRLKKVQVRKEYPGTLMIEVEERTPIALVARRTSNGQSTVYLPVDREGVVFRPTQQEVKELPDRVPVVKGFPQLEEGSPAFRRRWTKALNVLDSVDKRFSSDLIKWVQVRTGGYVQIKIKHPKELKIRLGEARYDEKLDKLKEMMQTNQFLDIKKYVNLTQLQNVRAL